MAISAKAMNKPCYVVAESFKFTRLYPLNQYDLPDEFKVSFKFTRLYPLNQYDLPDEFKVRNYSLHGLRS
jgi:translation initiation factor eIF-2B subunit alpha